MKPATTYVLSQTFLPFDGGWRTFPHHYLLYAASGAFQLETDEGSWLLPSQRAAWIRAEIPIHICCRTPVACRSLILDATTVAPPPVPCRVFAVSPLVRELLQHATRYGPDHVPTVQSERCFEMIVDVCRELAGEPDVFWLPRAHTPDLAAALAYTTAHLADDLSFDAVAREAACSERTLARRFATELGMTWRQFLQRVRIIRASELFAIEQGTVLEVAYATGFASVSAFSKAFRDLIGLSPAAFREQMAAEMPDANR